MAEVDGALAFEVADDGAGFEVAGSSADGHGFVNMADRLGAFGGTLDVRLGARRRHHGHAGTLPLSA